MARLDGCAGRSLAQTAGSRPGQVSNNESAATFKFTIENTKSKRLIEVGRIRTTNPSGTHGIPADKCRAGLVLSQ